MIFALNINQYSKNKTKAFIFKKNKKIYS